MILKFLCWGGTIQLLVCSIYYYRKLIFYKQLQPYKLTVQGPFQFQIRLQFRPSSSTIGYSSGSFLVLEQVTVQGSLALQQVTVQVPFQFQSRLQFRFLSSSRVGYSSGSFLVLELVTVQGPFYFQIKLQFRVLFQFQNKLKLRSI